MSRTVPQRDPWSRLNDLEKRSRDNAVAAAAAAGVDSVTAGDDTITMGGTSTDPTVEVTPGIFATPADVAAAVDDLSTPVDVPAGSTFTVPADSQVLYAQPITVEGAVRVEGGGLLIDVPPPPVSSVTAGDASISVTGSGLIVVESGTLDQIANLHPPAANWSNSGRKITNLANGSAASDAAAFGQIPTSLPPNGAAGGDLTGTFPSPTLAAIGSAAGPVGDGTHVAQVSIDAKGRVTALTSIAITAGGGLTVVSTTFTTNAYTLALADAATAQQASNGATAATITIPLNASVAFPINTMLTITQTGTGKIRLAAAGGVTVECAGGFTSGTTGCRAEYSTIALLKVATDTWVLSGDFA